MTRRFAAAPLLGVAGPRVVDQDPAHGLGGDREEVAAVLPGDARLVDEAEIRLVDDGRRLERVARALSPELALGDLAQLRIDERHEPLDGRRVAFVPGDEKPRHFAAAEAGIFGVHRTV